MAKFKVGDKVWAWDKPAVIVNPKPGESSHTGYYKIEFDNGQSSYAPERILVSRNSVCNAKFKVGDTVEAIRDRVHKLGVKGTVLKVGADTMVVKWADDGFTASYGIEGNFKNLTKEPKATPEDKMKAELSRSGAGSNPRTAHMWLTQHRRGLVSKYGREAYEKVMREATRGLLNAQIRSTNANTKWVIHYWDGGKEKIEAPTRDAAKREADKRARKSGRGYKRIIVDDGVDYGPYLFFNSVCNIRPVRAPKSAVIGATEIKTVKPEGQKVPLKLVKGKDGHYYVIFKDGQLDYGSDIREATKGFDEAVRFQSWMGTHMNSVRSTNAVVAKALNAVRNAWADAPDAATAKRDIEQTVRKAAEIAKKQSGAKATYKLTPNDSHWCGYIDLAFNTEEEAKKYNPYYLFNELGDNKSILPKWAWAISSFSYQKNGKVVKIFVGRLAT
jgi:hypothetical protein